MVLNQLQNVASQATGQQGSPGAPPVLNGRSGYPRTLKEGNFIDEDIEINEGKYELLGYYTVGAQQIAEVGQGSSRLDPMEQGRPLIDLRDTDDDPIDGDIRVTHESAQETRTYKVEEDTTESFRESQKSERPVMPRKSTENFPRVREDSKIGIYVNASDAGNGTVSLANTKIRLPVTLYE